MTPLVMASVYGYVDMVNLVIEYGADPMLPASNGVTPLDAAVSAVSDIDQFTLGSRQEETVRAILDEAPDANLSKRSSLWDSRIGGRGDHLPARQPSIVNRSAWRDAEPVPPETQIRVLLLAAASCYRSAD